MSRTKVSIVDLRRIVTQQGRKKGVKADSKMTNEGVVEMCDEILGLRKEINFARKQEAELRLELGQAITPPMLAVPEDSRDSYFVYTRGIPVADNIAPICCQALEELRHEYDWPFVNPLVVGTDPAGEYFEVALERLALKMIKLTPMGNVSKRGQSTFLVNFCPICGERLSEKKTRGGQIMFNTRNASEFTLGELEKLGYHFYGGPDDPGRARWEFQGEMTKEEYEFHIEKLLALSITPRTTGFRFDE